MSVLRWLMGGQVAIAAVQAARHAIDEEYASALVLLGVLSLTTWVWVYAEHLYKRSLP